MVKELPPVEDEEWKLQSLEASGEEDTKPSVSSPVKDEEVLTVLALSSVNRWPLNRPSVVFNVLMLICRKKYSFKSVYHVLQARH